jgi:hypothetical protein
MVSGKMGKSEFIQFLRTSSNSIAAQYRWLDPLHLHGLGAYGAKCHRSQRELVFGLRHVPWHSNASHAGTDSVTTLVGGMRARAWVNVISAMGRRL